MGAIALRAGFHPIEIDFKEIEGNERLRLYYRKSESANWIFMELEDFFRTTDRNKTYKSRQFKNTDNFIGFQTFYGSGF